MRSNLVVFVPPVFDDHLRFHQGPDFLSFQAFLQEPCVKALNEDILPRTTRLDTKRFDSLRIEPEQKFLTDELTSVVTADVLGSAMDPDRLF
jgi:hypothetical protein